MRNEFTAIFELDDESRLEPFYFANCPEIIGARAEGKTMDEARDKLAETITQRLRAPAPDACSQAAAAPSLRRRLAEMCVG